MKELTVENGEVQDARRTDPFAGMQLDCTDCPMQTRAIRQSDDPSSVCRCRRCGKKHSTDSLEPA